MTFETFNTQGANLTVGDTVRVVYKGRGGVRDRVETHTIERTTKTQVTLDDGIRFLRSNGRAMGEPLTRWGGGSLITHVKA